MSPESPPPPPPFSPVAGSPPGGGAPRTSIAAVLSLVFGLTSLLCSCFTAVPGLICGIVGLAGVGRSNGLLKGRGMAILGILLSLALPIVGAGIAYLTYGKEAMAAGTSAYRGTIAGTELMTALKAHADSHDGRLPASFDELLAAASIEKSTLADPRGGEQSGFWKLEQPGAVLGNLEPTAVVVRGGPIAFMGQSLEIVILANGTVEPRTSGLPSAGGASAPDGGVSSGATETGPSDSAADPAR